MHCVGPRDLLSLPLHLSQASSWHCQSLQHAMCEINHRGCIVACMEGTARGTVIVPVPTFHTRMIRVRKVAATQLLWCAGIADGLATSRRACWYDRLGYGWSDDAFKPTTTDRVRLGSPLFASSAGVPAFPCCLSDRLSQVCLFAHTLVQPVVRCVHSVIAVVLPGCLSMCRALKHLQLSSMPSLSLRLRHTSWLGTVLEGS